MADEQEQPRSFLSAVLVWSALRESFGLRRSIASSAVVLGLILVPLASATS